ncbi:SURF1 family protein [Actinocrinis puniceicyclus]|uniref:SURF1-like protein n=1 Tax=Actinocrinis puniceicyclus TaxID=977794 RepID=A0A8J7WG90_9ACTN|nr:SURF1 family protein [Actinocrinis puniceicyclus]MBS2961603.1 SURF1 family protein [Actinocrinis puniceicyclus]
MSDSAAAPHLTRDDLRSPRWIAAHVGIAALVVAFLLLGRWQWHVGHRIAPLTAHQLAAWRSPVPASSLITADGVDGTKIGQAVTATGTYDATRQLLVPGRTLGGHAGYYLITPLVTAPGQAIAVNRGWLPADGAAEPAIPAPPPGRVAVTGWVAGSESATGSVNQNGIVQTLAPRPAAGPHEVGVISAAQLVNLWPYHLPNGYLSATDAASLSGALTPVPAPLPPHGTTWDLLNVGYAFQWCVFAVVTVGWYLLHWRRELRASAALAEARADHRDGASVRGDDGQPGRDMEMPEPAALDSRAAAAQRETGESAG